MNIEGRSLYKDNCRLLRDPQDHRTTVHMLVVVYSSSSIVPAAAQHLISFCLKFAFGVQNLDQAASHMIFVLYLKSV